MPAHVNTYSGGIDRDSAKNKYQHTSYYNMKNMRLTSFEELSNGAVQSIEGNSLKIQVPPGYEYDIIIGQCVIRNWLVAWSTDDNTEIGGRGTIWKTDLSVAVPVWTSIYQSDYLYLTTLHPIFEEAIGFYEGPDRIKVYWTDNHNMLRHIDIMDTYAASYDVTLLDILPDVTLATPTVKNIGGGKLSVGKVQYAYQYYNIGGVETSFSQCTPLIHLTKSSEYLSGSSIRLYEGAEALDESGNPNDSGKSVTIQINGIDTDYEKIRVVAIHYRNLYQDPDIHIVGEYDAFDHIYVTDTGNYTKGTLTLNAFRTLGNHELYCKTISQKGNKAIIGNVTEKFFDIDELLGYYWDARTYRFAPYGNTDPIFVPYTLTVTDIAHISTAECDPSKIMFLLPTPPAIAALATDSMTDSGVATYLKIDYTETVTHNADSAIWSKWRSAGNITFQYISDNEIEVHITGFQAWAETQPGFDITWTVDDILAFIGDSFISGKYEDTLGNHDVDFSGLGTGSNLVYAADSLSFLITANLGDFFADFAAFEPVFGLVQFAINYNYLKDYSYTFETSTVTDLDYVRASFVNNPVNWKFEINKLTPDPYISCLDPFDATKITDIHLILDTEYAYIGIAGDSYIKVYNQKTNAEQSIATDVNINAWPNSSYTLGGADVPEDHDCINPFNYDFLYGQGVSLNPQIDEYATFWDSSDFTINPETGEQYIANQCKYQHDLLTLGGEGPHIKYQFTNNNMFINKSTDTRYTEPENITIEDLTSYNSYKNPIKELLYTGYKHDETYRFGVVFTDEKGRDSFAKWIGDIKFPPMSTIGYQGVTTLLGVTSAYNLGITFSIDTTGLYTAGVRGVRIVRVERREEDRTIYSQGIISNMFLFDCYHTDNAYSNMIVGYPRATIKTPTEGVNANYVRQGEVVQFISPEINLFKDLQPSAGDYIKIQAKLGDRSSYLSYLYNGSTAIDVAGHLDRTTILGGIQTFAANYYDHYWYSVSRYKTTDVIPDVTDNTIKRLYNVVSGDIAGYVPHGSEQSNGIVLPSSPGGATILNRSVDIGAGELPFHEGPSGTCAVMVLDNAIDTSQLTSADELELYIVDYKKRGRGAVQYGGLSYEARQGNTYIDCGSYTLIPPAEGTLNMNVFGGDSYIGYFDHLKTIWEAEDLDGDGSYDVGQYEKFFTMTAFPCESHINLDLLHGDRFAEYYNNDLVYAIRELAGRYDADVGVTVNDDHRYWMTQEEDLYKYNPVYSQPNNTKIYFVKPDDWEAEVVEDTLVKASLEKYPREEVDAYLKFLTDNEKLLPTEFGPINDLFLFKNYMIVFMDHAMGTVSIDERALLPIQNNSILELGAANNLQHFDFISNISGSIHPQSIEYCGDGFLWYDAHIGSVGYYNGNTQDLGLTKGMSSVIRRHTDLLTRPDGSFSANQLYGGNVICKQNHKYKETLVSFMYSEFAVLEDKDALELTFRLDRSPGHYDNKRILINGVEYMAERITHTSGGFGVIGVTVADNLGLTPMSASWSLNKKYHIVFIELSETYSFSSIINAFMYQADIYPTWYVQHNRQLYDVYGQFSIWKEFSNSYGLLYGEYRNGEIEYVINPKGSLVCLFNNFEYSAQAYNDANENLISETWDSIRIWNDYQYSASAGYSCVFTSGTGYIRRSTLAPHELETGDLISFSGTLLPITIDISRYYYVHKIDDTNFQISQSNNDIYVTFASDTTGFYHEIDIPLSVITEPVNDKRRIRTWRIKDIRDYRGFIHGRLKPRMRDTHLRLLLKYLHGDNKRLIMDDLITYYTMPRETIGNNQ